MKKSEYGFIDPYGLGFIVILIGSLIGGIQHSGPDQQVTVVSQSTGSEISEQESNHATRK